jgi:prophage regulatory protein
MNSTQLPFPKLLGKADIQKLLDVSDRTLEKMVRARQFPPPLRLGKTVRWAETVIQQWLATRLEAQMAWQPPKRAARAVPGTVKS